MDKRKIKSNLSSEKGAISTAVFVTTIIVMFITFLVVLGVLAIHYTNQINDLKLTQPTDVVVDQPDNNSVSLEDRAATRKFSIS